MAKINLAGDSIVITSAVKTEDIQTIEKYNPAALTLKEKNEDGKLEEVFRVGTGKGGINKYGVTFCGTSRDGNGLATLTIPFAGSTDPDTAKDQIADTYGVAIANLNKVEAAIPAALAEIKKAKKAVVDAITVG